MNLKLYHGLIREKRRGKEMCVWNTSISRFPRREMSNVLLLRLLPHRRRREKEHLNPFGRGNSVADHYIEDGTRWGEREEGVARPPIRSNT